MKIFMEKETVEAINPDTAIKHRVCRQILLNVFLHQVPQTELKIFSM